MPTSATLKPISFQELKWKHKLNANRSIQYEHSRGYVREALSHILGIPPLNIPIVSPPGLPPKLPTEMGYVSFSHCKDGLLIGWSIKNIGVDIERYDRIFFAEKIINGNIIIAYSDILFESNVVKRLLESDHDISVVVDIDWQGYYVGRKDHPISEAENVIFDSNNQVLKIGKIGTQKEEVHGEFIGMIKLSNRGTQIFKENFHRVKKIYWNKPFQRASVFQKAYLTDMIQELVDIGVKIHCVIIERGWKEIDTVEDYQKALKEFNQ